MVRLLVLIEQSERNTVMDVQALRVSAKHATPIAFAHCALDLCPMRSAVSWWAALIVRRVAANPMPISARTAAVFPCPTLILDLRRATKEHAAACDTRAFNLSVLARPPRGVLTTGRAMSASSVFNQRGDDGEWPTAEVARSFNHRCTTPRSLSLWRYSCFSEIPTHTNKLRYVLALDHHPRSRSIIGGKFDPRPLQHSTPQA